MRETHPRPRSFLFDHIPKTTGTTLRAVFSELLDAEQVSPPVTGRSDLWAMRHSEPYLSNFMTNHFSLKHSRAATAGPAALNAAKQVLRSYDCVGLHEELNRFVEHFCRTYGFTAPATLPNSRLRSSRRCKPKRRPRSLRSQRTRSSSLRGCRQPMARGVSRRALRWIESIMSHRICRRAPPQGGDFRRSRGGNCRSWHLWGAIAES
jgi:hypothetical protein